MDIKKPELFAVAITAVFLAFVLGFFTGSQNKGDGITVQTQNGSGVTEAAAAFSSDDRDSMEKTAERININTAGAEELMTLPHVGEVIAGRIIDYREENGDFKIIEEITDVQGIGDKIFEEIRELITVD